MAGGIYNDERFGSNLTWSFPSQGSFRHLVMELVRPSDWVPNWVSRVYQYQTGDRLMCQKSTKNDVTFFFFFSQEEAHKSADALQACNVMGFLRAGQISSLQGAGTAVELV